MKTDLEKTLAVLKRVGPYGIHSFHLAREVGSTRVAARVDNLKNLGYIITSEPETLGDSRGCRYYLKSSPFKTERQEIKQSKPVRWEIDKERNVAVPVYA